MLGDDRFDQLPPPSAGDVIFAPDPANPEMNACLRWMDDPSILYSAGYRLAGRVLADQARENNSDLDLLIYPIVYCYRQHTEQMLKDLVFLCERSNGVPPNSTKPLEYHRLVRNGTC